MINELQQPGWTEHYSRSHTRTTTLHPFNCLFSRTTWVSQYQKGKTSLDLNETKDDGVLGWQWHQLDHMQTICTSLQPDEHTNTWSLNFYRPNALADAKPTVSKHWRHIHALSKNTWWLWFGTITLATWLWLTLTQCVVGTDGLWKLALNCRS